MTTELLQLLLLIIIANGAPILIHQRLKNRFNYAVDFGKRLPDNYPVFGSSKTWRGIIAALLITPIVAWLIGRSLEVGLLIAIYAICGDLFSSFIKRRLKMKASSMAPFLDQVPESLFPAFMLRQVFGLDYLAVAGLVLLFIIIELWLSHILFRWGMRNKPY